MNTRAKGITRTKLVKNYPDIAKLVDRIYEKDRKTNYWFFVNYMGKYMDKNGNPRTVSIGAVIDLLEAYGYTIDIKAKKDSDKKILWDKLYI